MNRRLTRIVVIAGLALTGLFALSSSASATYDQNFIRQIHPSLGINGGEWVELQMYADGQNQVAGKLIRTFDPSGILFSQYAITPRMDTPNAPNGQNQRTILISSLFTPANVTADFVAPVADLQMTGQDGAVCYTENDPPNYTPIDCVSYGAFTGTNIPTAGTPAVATPFESTLERGITRGCATALDPADDSNNSSADFALSTNPPRNNATAPTEVLCPEPGGGAGTGGGAGPVTGAGTVTTPAACAGRPATITGTNGSETLTGTPAADVIAGLGGNDLLKGLAGNDVICGGAGKDRELGGGGNDKLLGEAGKDILRGGPGKDKLKGGAGKDVQIQ